MVDEWKNPNLINEAVLNSLTKEQLDMLAEMLAEVK